MSRSIEFRAWCKNIGKMVDLKAITGLALSSTLMQDGLFLPFHNDIILMQFTGLLDKNGKKIFEEDIIQEVDIYGTANTFSKCRKVEWGFHSDHSSYMYQIGFNLWEEEIYLVVGNIYENPELLEDAP